MAEPLTDRQREVLELYVVAVRDGTPWPTCRDICTALDISSTHAVWCFQRAIVQKGWLEHDRSHARAPYLLTDHTRRIYGLPRRAA